MIHFYQRQTSCRETISQDNFFAIAEVITIKATRIISLKNKRLRDLYNNLIRDIFHISQDGYILTDSFDLLQEVSFILYQNIGKKISDVISYDGKTMTVNGACNRIINQTVYRTLKYYDNTCPVIPNKTEMPTIEYSEELNDYTKADEIIQSLNLNETQLAVLNCLIANMRHSEIISTLNISKPWNYRVQIQNRYRKIFG